MTATFGFVGVPSSAGARTPGQEKAPAAVRAAGLLDLMRQAGCDVIDHGDLPVVISRPDPAHRRAQNLPAVVSVARAVATAVERVLDLGNLPLLVGGDCTITVGAVSGFLQAERDVNLLYVDGGVDLYVPDTQPAGHLDSMGVAHMIAEPGSTPELSGIGPRTPLLDPGQIVYFGQGAASVRPLEAPEDVEGVVFARHGFRSYPLEHVEGRPEAAAEDARASLETDGRTFLVHFDVDVLDFLDAPLADVPEDRGLSLDDAMTCLRVFAASPQFGGLVVTEINPDHSDPGDDVVRRFARRLADALGQAEQRSPL